MVSTIYTVNPFTPFCCRYVGIFTYLQDYKLITVLVVVVFCEIIL